MLKNKVTKPSGFTLTELMITTAVAAIVVLGLGFVLADSNRSWQKMYESTNSDFTISAQIVRKTFESVVRKASSQSIQISSNGREVKVYYYDSSESSELDCYASFYFRFNKLNVDYGSLVSGSEVWESTQTLCSDVSSCVFTNTGDGVQMVLCLDDGYESITVVSSAVAHN